MLVGDIRIEPLIDGEFRFDRSLLYPKLGAGDWSGVHARWLAPDGTVPMPFGCFLVVTGDRRVLVDAGLGPYTHEGMWGGRLLGEMHARGLEPAGVTDVVFTHLHFDHVGWATQQERIVFERATYRCDARDWEHFMADPSARRKLEPLAERVSFWDGAVTLAPGIDTLPAPGHTPGHTAIVVSSGAERAILLGDVAHCPAEMEEPEWDGISDVDPDAARAMRERLMDLLEREGHPATGAHFPELAFGRVVRTQGKRLWLF